MVSTPHTQLLAAWRSHASTSSCHVLGCSDAYVSSWLRRWAISCTGACFLYPGIIFLQGCYRGSIEKFRFRVWRGVGVIFTSNVNLWIAQKLRIISLLHIGLVTCGMHFPKIQKVFSFLNSGPSGHDHGPPKQLFLILAPPNYSKEFRKSRTIFNWHYSWKSPIGKNGRWHFQESENSRKSRFGEF